MRDFHLTSEEAEIAFALAEGEVLQEMVKRDVIYEDNLKQVLDYILDAESNSYAEYSDEHGEQAAIDNHIWYKAFSVYIDFGFDGQAEHAEVHYLNEEMDQYLEWNKIR